MQKEVSHLLFLKSISKRGGGAKWISGRWMNINNGVTRWEVNAFLRTMLETLDYTLRIGSTPTFLYFDLYLYSAYAAHYVY